MFFKTFAEKQTESKGRRYESDVGALKHEIKRLRLENWQLKSALGYPVPGDIPEGDFKCGLCEAREVAKGATA